MVSDMCARAASESLRLSMCFVHEICDGCVPLSFSYQTIAFNSVPMPDIPSLSRPRSHERTAPNDEVWLVKMHRSEKNSITHMSPDRAAVRLFT
jgi:hypothetical protein